MDFAVLHRAEGKTHLAIEWLKADPDHRVLLTTSEALAADVKKRHRLGDRQVMSYRAAPAALRGRSNIELAVDDLDAILPALLGIGPLPIVLVTATGNLAVPTLEPAEA
jgi:hypothetical protein